MMNAPVSKTPKRIPLDRRVNFVWFVDTSRTHSFTLSYRALWIAGLVSAALAGGLVGEALYIRKLRDDLTQHQSLIRDLRRSVVEGLFRSVQEPSPRLAAVAVPSPRPPATEPSGAAPAEASGTPVPTPTPNPLPTVVRFEKATMESDEDGVHIRFVLTTTSARDQALAGRVCALVRTHSGQKLLAAPDLLKPHTGSAGCPEGLNVRFAKLRPTEISVKAEASEIASVELRFVDKGSQKVTTHTITNQ